MSAPAPSTAAGLLWTSDALDAIRALRAAEERPDAAFRVDVMLGGCKGFKLFFRLDDLADDDEVFDAGDVRIAVQRDGMPLVAGSILDYENSHRGSGFRLANPRATIACGCGTSFNAPYPED